MLEAEVFTPSLSMARLIFSPTGQLIPILMGFLHRIPATKASISRARGILMPEEKVFMRRRSMVPSVSCLRARLMPLPTVFSR